MIGEANLIIPEEPTLYTQGTNASKQRKVALSTLSTQKQHLQEDASEHGTIATLKYAEAELSNMQ